MPTAPQQDVRLPDVSRFQACMEDLREAVAHLQSIEDELADTVQEMQRESHSPERLFLAEDVLADLRAALGQIGYVRRVSQT